ncbi:MAG: hypothetical protein EOO43_15760 [Flavobacterium sp.]|nr:MAG: hypothetical protein EOO43_15760 [Flavobacterium sp.]
MERASSFEGNGSSSFEGLSYGLINRNNNLQEREEIAEIPSSLVSRELYISREICKTTRSVLITKTNYNETEENFTQSPTSSRFQRWSQDCR